MAIILSLMMLVSFDDVVVFGITDGHAKMETAHLRWGVTLPDRPEELPST